MKIKFGTQKTVDEGNKESQTFMKTLTGFHRRKA